MTMQVSDIIDAAKEGLRIDPPSSSDYVTFYCSDVAQLDLELFKSLLDEARKETGVCLKIIGGGAGCLRIVCKPDDAALMKQLVTSSDFRKRAAEAGIEAFWVDKPHMSIPTKRTEDEAPVRATFGILAPLAEEFRALRTCLRRHASAERKKYCGVHTYYTYAIDSDYGDQYEIVSTFMPRMGNDSAALATFRLIQDWNPRYLLLTGIAGSLDNSRPLGDVIVADEVMRYDRRRKVRDDGIAWAPSSYSTDRLLLNRASAHLLEDEKIEVWQKHCGDDHGNLATAPSASVENIACGDGVIDSEDIKSEILHLNRTCKAIEMEAGGFLEAIINQAVVGKALVVRGLSDYAAGKSDTDSDPNHDWRGYAARNAAQFLVSFIRGFSTEYSEVDNSPALAEGR